MKPLKNLKIKRVHYYETTGAWLDFKTPSLSCKQQGQAHGACVIHRRVGAIKP